MALMMPMATMVKAQERIAGQQETIAGKQKALVLLVQFTDAKFQSGHNAALYDQILNGVNFSNDMGFVGSVNDYFRDMSGGQFEFEFDVFGPILVGNKRSYYGKDEGILVDTKLSTLIKEACEYADEDYSELNFGDYDTDGDGEVDLLAVIYAGQGSNASNEANAADFICPQEGELSNTYSSEEPFTLDGVKIDKFACSCELNINKTIDGIGVLCHEFSHSIGLHDMYDTSGGGRYGMNIWSMMDMGNYLGDSFIPVSYTAFERMACGWRIPTVLNNDTIVSNMKAIEDGGETFIIFNDANKNEYYLLENRQPVGWDAGLNYNGTDYGRGLIITHVDYNQSAWDGNIVNNNVTQRCTIFHADGKSGKTTVSDIWGDPFPYTSGDGSTIYNNALTNTSSPKASLNNANIDGTKLMNKAITDITQNTDGSISFKFTNNNGTGTGIDNVVANGNGNLIENLSGKPVYGLDGRLISNDIKSLPKGIYIVGGKKFVK